MGCRFRLRSAEEACSVQHRVPVRAPVHHQLWEPTILEHWAVALCTPSMQPPHMECSAPHTLGTEFIPHVIKESIRVWYAHGKAHATLLNARLGPGSTMAWVLQELCLHEQAEKERGCKAGTFGVTAVARRLTSRFSRLPLFPPITTH